MPRPAKVSSDSIDMLQVAKMFYREGLTKLDIADNLRIDPRTVSATLKRAIDTGMVHIEIRETQGNTSLKEQIGRKYPHILDIKILPTSGIVENKDQYFEMLQRFGKVAADLLDNMIERQERDRPFRVGISGGETLLEFVNAVPERLRANLHVHAVAVVPHGPSKMYASGVDPTINSTILWAKSGRRADHCHFTTIAPYDTKEKGARAHNFIQAQRAELAKNSTIKTVIEGMQNLDVVFTGLGTFTRPGPGFEFMNARLTTMSVLQPQLKIKDFVKLKAVGDLGYCLIDANGESNDDWRFFPSIGDYSHYKGVKYYRHMVQRKKPVVAIAGPFRLDPIKAALRGKLINILITDDVTAQQIAEGD